MKHTKFSLIVFIFTLSILGRADTNPILINYFEEAYSKEKNKFLNCIEDEGLPLEAQIYTNCKISQELRDAALLTNNNKNIDVGDLLNHIKKFKNLKKVNPRYPKRAQNMGRMGYVIVQLDIAENGNTENHKVIERYCGDGYNPATKYISCKDFDSASLLAAKKLKYEPTYFENSPIRHKDVLYRYTYLMEQYNNVVLDKGVYEYNRLIAAIRKREFKKALDIANENLDKDSYFLYQKAVIKFYMKDYEQSIGLFNQFSDRVSINKKEVNYEYHVTSFSMLIASLFNLGNYQEIIDLEKNYNLYARERNEHASLLAVTNFYIGAAFVNTGNIPKGAFYMTLASRNSSSKAQSDYFDSYIDRISNYL